MPLLVLPHLMGSLDNGPTESWRGAFPNMQGGEQPWLCAKAPPGEPFAQLTVFSLEKAFPSSPGVLRVLLQEHWRSLC